MTAWIDINKYWGNRGIVFKQWFEAYGFTITDKTADVIVVDYDTWMSTRHVYKDDSLILVVNSYYMNNMEILPNVLFRLIPIDYPILIEYIIKLLKSKKNNYYSIN